MGVGQCICCCQHQSLFSLPPASLPYTPLALLLSPLQDMTPYVPLLMPELQKSLVDPLPEVRAVSARAMGSLLKGMGTETFADLVPWLMATLRSDGSSVERSGAAQVREGSGGGGGSCGGVAGRGRTRERGDGHPSQR